MSLIGGFCQDFTAFKTEQIILRHRLYNLKYFVAIVKSHRSIYRRYIGATDVHRATYIRKSSIYPDKHPHFSWHFGIMARVIKLDRKYFTGDLPPRRISIIFGHFELWGLKIEEKNIKNKPLSHLTKQSWRSLLLKRTTFHCSSTCCNEWYMKHFT